MLQDHVAFTMSQSSIDPVDNSASAIDDDVFANDDIELSYELQEPIVTWPVHRFQDDDTPDNGERRGRASDSEFLRAHRRRSIGSSSACGATDSLFVWCIARVLRHLGKRFFDDV
jgi:hypothetical protein